MLPEIYKNISEFYEAEQPSRTYRLDLTNKRIYGIIDDYEAVYQAVWKVLLTQEGNPIYLYGYGVDIDGLIGKENGYATSELKRRITEALEQDNRIISVEVKTTKNFKGIVEVVVDVVTTFGVVGINLGGVL